MEIVRKKKESCLFEEIEEGQCFVIDTDVDAIFMRTCFVSPEYAFAAIDLETGQLLSFKRDSIVTPVKATIVLE